MLYQIRDFISREGYVTNEQLSRKFCLTQAALDPMIALLVKKGLIELAQKNCGKACGSCKTKVIMYKIVNS